VQHQRDGHGGPQPVDELEVEHGAALPHRVPAPDRHRQGVNRGRGDERGGLGGVGADARSVRAALPADLAQLRLDPQPVSVRPARRLPGGGEVRGVIEGRSVEHHRAGRAVGREVQQFHIVHVVKVQ